MLLLLLEVLVLGSLSLGVVSDFLAHVKQVLLVTDFLLL
jgi:hypothetical protein